MPTAFKQFVAKIKLPNNIEICFSLLFLCLQIMELKAQSEIKVEIDYLSKKKVCYLQIILCPAPVKLYHRGVKNLINLLEIEKGLPSLVSITNFVAISKIENSKKKVKKDFIDI